MRLSDFRDAHRGEPFVVVACGPSARDWAIPPGVITIGVTDCERHIQPGGRVDYLVVTDDTQRFLRDAETPAIGRMRLATIGRTDATVFCHDHEIDGWAECVTSGDVVAFQQGADGGVSPCDGVSLHHSKTSVYQALLLAEYMGASRIGMIGMDLASHPNLNWRLELVTAHLTHLADAIIDRGTPVWNLSDISAVRPSQIPRMTTEEFAHACVG